GITTDHHRVARALLFGLFNKTNARAGRGLAHLFSLVPDHGEDAFRWSQGERGIYDMLEKSFSSGFVQHFGLTALHTGAESGSEDHDGNGLLHYYYYAFLRRLPSC